MSTMSKVQSNDEVIEDITKDLESQSLAMAKDGNSTTRNIPETQSDESTMNEMARRALHGNDDDDIKPAVPDDYIDENALQEQETSLTEDDLHERHLKSIQIKNKGNQEFKKELYLRAIDTYTEGLKICPLKHNNDRAILYCNRSACKLKLYIVGPAIKDCTKAIELNSEYKRAYLRRATAYEEMEQLDEALADFKKLLELDPNQREAREAMHRLPALIEARNEKLKDEMIGKLKDLGNMFLKPFGLSTNNFKMQQDPNTGGYSVNFQQ